MKTGNMTINDRLTAILCSSALMLFMTATEARAEVVAELSAQRITLDGGKETRTAAREAKPGEVLEYRAIYRNTGKQAARQVLAVLPIPAGAFSYVVASARPAKVFASVDGKQFDVAPLMRTVTLPDGRREVRPVPLAEYRFLRWELGDMQPGTESVVSARLRLLDNAGGAQ